jgi:hypothetical protein
VAHSYRSFLANGAPGKPQARGRARRAGLIPPRVTLMLCFTGDERRAGGQSEMHTLTESDLQLPFSLVGVDGPMQVKQG